MKEVVIVSGVRTAIGDFLGSLKDLTCVDLGVIVLKSAMAKANVDPKLIEEVVCGNPDMAGRNRTPAGRWPSMQDVPGRLWPVR